MTQVNLAMLSIPHAFVPGLVIPTSCGVCTLVAAAHVHHCTIEPEMPAKRGEATMASEIHNEHELAEVTSARDSYGLGSESSAKLSPFSNVDDYDKRERDLRQLSLNELKQLTDDARKVAAWHADQRRVANQLAEHVADVISDALRSVSPQEEGGAMADPRLTDGGR